MLNTTTLLLLLALAFYVSHATPVTQQKEAHQYQGNFFLNILLTALKGDEHVKTLAAESIDYAHHVGLKFRTAEDKGRSDVATIVPFSLVPSPFPRRMYEEAVAVHEAMALLYFRAAWDYKFLTTALDEIAKTDNTVGNLMKIYREAHEEGANKQPIAVLPMRDDYMMHINKEDDEGKYELKQVEVNIGYMGGASRGPRATLVHRRITEKLGFDGSRVPENHALETVCKGVHLAWKMFNDPEAVLIMLCNPLSRGHFEPRAYEYELERVSEGKMPIILMSMQQFHDKVTLEDDFNLRLDDGRRVAVVFQRATVLASARVLPDSYWAAKRMLERSRAIKIPTIGEELASTKKVQQALAEPGAVERYFPDPRDKPKVVAIRKTFAGLWGLQKDGPETDAVVKDAIAHTDRYVLKPQREGGGRNIWEQEMKEKLEQFSPSERAEYILQQRLDSPITENYYIVPKEEPKFGKVITELSTFGCLVGNGVDGTVFMNEGTKKGTEGYFMRTKWSHVTEGGVLKGEGVYDSPYLF